MGLSFMRSGVCVLVLTGIVQRKRELKTPNGNGNGNGGRQDLPDLLLSLSLSLMD